MTEMRYREALNAALREEMARAAVSSERIAARRYESYRRLHRLYERLAP